MALFLVKAVRHRETVFEPLVPEPVGQIAVEKPAVVHLGGGHSSQPQSYPFCRVVADEVVHRPDVETALFPLLGSGDVAGGENLRRGFQRLDDGQLPQLLRQTVDESLLGRQGHGPHRHPLLLPVPQCLGHHDAVFGRNLQRVGNADSGLEVVPHLVLANVDLPHLFPLYQRKRREGLRLRRGPPAAVGPREVLFYYKLPYKVHIDFDGHVEGVSLQGIGAVVHDVHPPVESEGLAVDGREGELNAGYAVHQHSVGDVIVVIGGGQGGG